MEDRVIQDIMDDIFRVASLGYKNIIDNVKDDPVLQVSHQEPPMSSKYPPSWPPLPDSLLIEISTQNFQGIFLGVYLNHP